MEHQRCQNSLTTVHLLDFRHVEACVDSFVWKACAHWPYSLSLSLSLSLFLFPSLLQNEKIAGSTGRRPQHRNQLVPATCLNKLAEY